ncbi:MAG TPA: hypothetical protein VFT99_01745 [Roseiflexaceae bacterium]|nr:hypothetical protein [Roseiflexaceae bacterium]
MQPATSRLLIGCAMIGAGLLLLLERFGLSEPLRLLLWAAMAGAAGTVFVLIRMSSTTHWWASIPGSVLLGLALVLVLQMLSPRAAASWSGMVFLGALALGFWSIFLSNRALWWAIIPGGVLGTLALISGSTVFIDPAWLGALFFAGFAATFGLVYLLAPGEQPRRWALYPAGIMLFMSLVVLAPGGMLFNFWWIVLILAGAYLTIQSLRPAKA